MPKRKLRDNAVVLFIREFDIFGEKARFNVNGEEQHRTCPGACVSLFIIILIGVFVLQYSIREFALDKTDRPLTNILYPDYYGKTNSPLK